MEDYKSVTNYSFQVPGESVKRTLQAVNYHFFGVGDNKNQEMIISELNLFSLSLIQIVGDSELSLRNLVQACLNRINSEDSLAIINEYQRANEYLSKFYPWGFVEGLFEDEGQDEFLLAKQTIEELQHDYSQIYYTKLFATILMSFLEEANKDNAIILNHEKITLKGGEIKEDFRLIKN